MNQGMNVLLGHAYIKGACVQGYHVKRLITLPKIYFDTEQIFSFSRNMSLPQEHLMSISYDTYTLLLYPWSL